MIKYLNYYLCYSNKLFYSNMASSRSNRFFPNPYFNEIKDKLPDFDQDLKTSTLDIVKLIIEKEKPKIKRDDGALYCGIAGIGFMFYYLSKTPTFKNEKSLLLKYANDYLAPALTYYESHCKEQSSKAAFLLGNAGLYTLAIALYSSLDDNTRKNHFIELFVSQKNICLPINFLSCGSDEMLVGRAGYLSAALWINQEIGSPVLSYDQLFEVCQSIVQSGRLYVKKHKIKSPPLMYAYYNVEYLGAAHGLAGILQMLLGVPGFIDSDETIARDVKESVDYLLSLQTCSGNFPVSTDEIESDELVHWCHGAPGIIYLMGKAFLVWKEEKYLQSCIKSGDLVWTKGLLRKGPGICHGIAGNGYLFLLLYRLTKEEKYLNRAKAFAHFMTTKEFKRARIPDTPYSLYEGLAGTACFYNDLLHPNTASFPFMNIY